MNEGGQYDVHAYYQSIAAPALQEAYNWGRVQQRTAWREWYDALPSDIRELLSEHAAHSAQRAAFRTGFHPSA